MAASVFIFPDKFILAQPSHEQTHWLLKHQLIFISLKLLGHRAGPRWAEPCTHTQEHEQDTLLQTLLSHQHNFKELKVWDNLQTHLSLYEHSES